MLLTLLSPLNQPGFRLLMIGWITKYHPLPWRSRTKQLLLREYIEGHIQLLLVMIPINFSSRKLDIASFGVFFGFGEPIQPQGIIIYYHHFPKNTSDKAIRPRFGIAWRASCCPRPCAGMPSENTLQWDTFCNGLWRAARGVRNGDIFRVCKPL